MVSFYFGIKIKQMVKTTIWSYTTMCKSLNAKTSFQNREECINKQIKNSLKPVETWGAVARMGTRVF